MKKQSILWAMLLFVLILLAFFIAFSKSDGAQNIRDAVEFSLEEDFKIKESLGKVFLVQNEEDSVSASTDITVSSFLKPSENYMLGFELGEPCLKIVCDKYASIQATGDGVVESVTKTRVTIRHYDGKLSEYKNVCALLKEGEKVLAGDSVGYSLGESSYKLYENCIALNPKEYIS